MSESLKDRSLMSALMIIQKDHESNLPFRMKSTLISKKGGPVLQNRFLSNMKLTKILILMTKSSAGTSCMNAGG